MGPASAPARWEGSSRPPRIVLTHCYNARHNVGVDSDYLRTFNVVIMVILIAVCTVMVLLVSTKSSAFARADRFSQRIRLPYGTPETRESVVLRVQAASRARAIALLIGVLAASGLLLTPLATTPAFPVYVIFPALIATGVVSAVMSVRERLFHPAPTSPRIARPRHLGAGDYLDPFRRLLPWGLACAAAASLAVLGLTWLRSPDRVDSSLALAATVFSVVALVAFIGVPLVERTVLARPQPATDTLELAWDDAFRATTLGELRLTMGFAAWLVLSLSVGALWVEGADEFSGLVWQVPTWGLIALQFVYPNTGRRLRAELYPDWLRRPVTAGGTA